MFDRCDRIDRLPHLWDRCRPQSEDVDVSSRDYWRAIAEGFAESLGLGYYDWPEALEQLVRYRGRLCDLASWPRRTDEFEVPDGRLDLANQVLCDELNLFHQSLYQGDPMPKKSKTVAPVERTAEDAGLPEWTPLMSTECLRRLCCPTPSDGMRDMKAATDDEILGRLMTLWAKPVSVRVPSGTDGAEVEAAASATLGPPLVWFGHMHTKGTPSLSGDSLIDAVRSIFGIAPGIETIPPANPKGEHEATLAWTLRKVPFAELAGREDIDDQSLLAKIHDAWKLASRDKEACPSGLPWKVQMGNSDWGDAIWIEDLKGAPRWWYRDGHCGLTLAVRHIFGILPPPSTKTKSKNGKATPKADPSSEPPADPLAGVEVIDEGEYPYEYFKRSPHNPRTAFDEDLIAQMAPSIASICRLNPILIHEDGTIIDGETRHRAAEKAGATSLMARRLRCTEAQAAILRMQSFMRRDLNPMDRAVAMKALQDAHGLTVDQVAKLVGMQRADSVRNIVRLLELPEEWQLAVRSEELTAAAARDLVPWKDEPAVLADVRKRLNQTAKESRSVDLPEILRRATWDQSRALKDYHEAVRGRIIAEINLKPTDEQRSQLRIRKVRYAHRNEMVERAFNVELWEELVLAADERRREREAKREEASSRGGKPDKAKAAENAKRQQDILAKKLYRFRVGWYQRMLVAKLQTAKPTELLGVCLYVSTRNEGSSQRSQLLRDRTGAKRSKDDNWTRDHSALLTSLVALGDKAAAEVVKELAIAQASQPYCGYHNILNPVEIEALAIHLGVDLRRDWPKSFAKGSPCEGLWDEFCGLWTSDQIRSLLEEWKIAVPAGTAKRKDLQALLSRAKPAPKAIVAAKAVSLV